MGKFYERWFTITIMFDSSEGGRGGAKYDEGGEKLGPPPSATPLVKFTTNFSFTYQLSAWIWSFLRIANYSTQIFPVKVDRWRGL